MEVSEKLTKQLTEVKYLSVENTDRYRPIIRCFFKSYEKLEYWLYKEDVFNELKESINDYTIELCEQDLLKLVEWKNLTNIQDSSNVKTIEEFKNRRYRYQLTEYAIEIERMVIRLETLNVETASLEPRLFEKLKILLTKIKDEENLEELNANFEELNETFTKLNNNYKDFLKMFSETKNEQLMKSEQFLIYKDKVIDYLNNFVSGFQLNEIKIKALLDEFPKDFEDKLIEKIIMYKKMQPILDENFNFSYLEDVLRGKWRSIIKWFANDIYEESETERLKKAINNIIAKITKYVISIVEANASINRMEEYKHILNLFLNCSSPESANALASVVFGIEKVKHFTNIEKATDSIDILAKNSIPTVINLKSHSRLIKEKSQRMQVTDKFFEKEKQLKEILLEKEKEEALLKKYLQMGNINISNLDTIEPFERRFLLSLLSKGMNKGIVKNNEYNISYKINKINDERIKLVSTDGTLTMDNIEIVFLGDNNGI